VAYVSDSFTMDKHSARIELFHYSGPDRGDFNQITVLSHNDPISRDTFFYGNLRVQ
jgi:hypothetical protein